MRVRRIAKEAFFGGIMEVLTIPDTLTQIGDSSFYNCKKLTEIVLPESLNEIGE
jgi:hypothetical protein